jgi:hypothetical protein
MRDIKPTTMQMIRKTQQAKEMFKSTVNVQYKLTAGINVIKDNTDLTEQVVC